MRGGQIFDGYLIEVSADLEQVVQKLKALTRLPKKLERRVYDLSGIRRHAETLAMIARKEHRARRLREELIPTQLFGEPAWDLLLDLFAHSIVNVEIPISSAQIGAHCAPTTALRYIEKFEDEGMIARHKSEKDGRVAYLKLTDAALVSVGSYLMNIAGIESERSIADT